MTDPQTVEPDNPAAWALARHIADHPVSTIQAAFRYLNAPLTIELHDQAAVPEARLDLDLPRLHFDKPTGQAERQDRYATTIHDAMEPDLSLVDQEPGAQALFARAAEAAAALADAELEQLREQHRVGLRRADEINNALMEEVQRYAAGEERPVLWSVYNEMHLRADNAEAAIVRVRRLHDRLAEETDLTSPDDEITRSAAAKQIATALDGWNPTGLPGCDVEFEGGGTCAKPAGHRPPGSDDPHVPEPDAASVVGQTDEEA